MESKGTIIPKQGLDTRVPYEHQKSAMLALDVLNREPSFSTMVVLPTGGGKTYTAVNWLLRNAVDKKKKVLWIAHRHMLLNQAAESFRDYAYANVMPNVGSFNYRIISGHKSHAKSSSIDSRDDVIIASKDSLRSQFDLIKKWLSGQDEAFLVVDEAHHATAKTYRNLIEMLIENVPRLKVIGLTATPFRTLEAEQGLLSKVFKDGVINGRAAKDSIGIAYQIGLQDLINRLILARPRIDACQTDARFGETLGAKEIEQMRRFDRIPEKVASQMVADRERNKLIVKTYLDNRERYGKTILFAVNISHAIALQELFSTAGVKSDYVVSSLRDEDTGTNRSQQQNDEAIERYAHGDLEVIINVNILTEGVDLPKTKTVFLTRPTSSTIMMTQMVGRALRGSKAGGTDECYIVTFVDGWDERVAWVNPSTLYSGEVHVDSDRDAREKEIAAVQAISISMISEFAQILDSTVDTSKIEAIPFIERIPLGMYMFKYTEEDEGDHEGADVSCQVMVYSSTKSAYEQFVAELPKLVSGHGLEDVEFASDELVESLSDVAEKRFFSGDFIPPYRKNDIASIIRYFVQFDAAPPFYPFDQIDRSKLDVSQVAKHIVEEDMGPRAKKEYEDSLWGNEDENLMRLLFMNKRNFLSAIDIEMRKLTNPEMFATSSGNVIEYNPTVPCSSGGLCSEGANDSESVQDGKTDSVKGGFDAPMPLAGSGVDRHVLEGGQSRITRREDQLRPGDDRFNAMGEYHSAGLARSKRTGMGFPNFNGKARESVDDGRLSLYSSGYRVAEQEPDGSIALLSYDLDGKRQGWDSSTQSFYHVSDFTAFRLGLEIGPTESELRNLAEDDGSRIRIAEVDVVFQSNPEVDSDLGNVAEGDSSKDVELSETEAAKIIPKYNDSLVSPVSTVPKLRSFASSSSRSDLREPPALVGKVTFESFGKFVSSGLINRYGDNTSADYSDRARLHVQNGFTYLYVKTPKASPLKIARWSENDGITLFEYDRGRGWHDRNVSAFSREFVIQMLGESGNITVPRIREMANNVAKPVRVEYLGAPTSKGSLMFSSGGKTKADQSASKTTRLGVQDSTQLLCSKDGRSSQQVQVSDISCISEVRPNSCRVYTKQGGSYSCPNSLSYLQGKLHSNSFARVSPKTLLRPSMITSLSTGRIKEANVLGVPRPVYVTDRAFADLVSNYQVRVRGGK